MILAFDTSEPACSAALKRPDQGIVTRTEPMKKGQAERLMPMIEEMLAEDGASWTDIAKIVVCTGPGNFTGTRIAVSAARGLALALKVPVIGVSRFEAAAFGEERPLAVAIPAPQDRIMLQVFESTFDAADPVLVSVEEAIQLTGGLPVICDSAIAVHFANSRPTKPDLCSACITVAEQVSHKSDTPPSPLYLRPASAEPSRQKPVTILP